MTVLRREQRVGFVRHHTARRESLVVKLTMSTGCEATHLSPGTAPVFAQASSIAVHGKVCAARSPKKSVDSGGFPPRKREIPLVLVKEFAGRWRERTPSGLVLTAVRNGTLAPWSSC